jgi:hypothetical protein
VVAGGGEGVKSVKDVVLFKFTVRLIPSGLYLIPNLHESPAS